MKDKEFTITQQHLALLQEANICWLPFDYGAPGLDPKRPYGNSDVEEDIARKLGIQPAVDDYISEAQRKEIREIHRCTGLALQIVLRVGHFTPGLYRASWHGRDWHLVEESK